jgi:hypothetical protein
MGLNCVLAQVSAPPGRSRAPRTALLSKVNLLLSKIQSYYQNPGTYYQKSNYIIKYLQLQPRPQHPAATLKLALTPRSQPTKTKKGKLPIKESLPFFILYFMRLSACFVLKQLYRLLPFPSRARCLHRCPQVSGGSLHSLGPGA